MRALSSAAALIAVLSSLVLAQTAARATPILQLYVEGSVYDETHESWVFSPVAGQPIRLWMIGNVDGPGGKGVIEDVKLAITYADPVPGDGGSSVAISLTPSTTGGYGGTVDPSIPDPATLRQIDEDGNRPTLFDGTPLASHGVYGDGFEWQEFALGDFTLTDSGIADFIDAFPTAFYPNAGQINVYDILVSGPVQDIHFDAYNHVAAGNHAKATFAPFSHDAGTGINHAVPEPVSLVLFATGLLLLSGIPCVLGSERRRAVPARLAKRDLG